MIDQITSHTTKNLPSLPESWRWTRTGDVIDVRDGTHDSPKYVLVGIPLVTSKNLKPSGIDFSGAFFISPEDHEQIQRRSAVEDRDILFAMIGTIGNPVVVKKEREFSIKNVALFKFASSPVLPEYFYFLLRSSFVLKQIRDATQGGIQKFVSLEVLRNLRIPVPPLPEQKCIVAMLTEQMAAVEHARAATEKQLEAATVLPAAYVRESFTFGEVQRRKLSECLIEVTNGVGQSWSEYRVIGATRSGIALAKESVGKKPERYKLVEAGTIFYNPMRILLGSIAMVDVGDEIGITSPDYVVFKTQIGILHHRWFYYWLRSPSGEAFIRTLTRGAVRERMLFRRLVQAEIEVPSWKAQCRVVEQMKAVRPMSELLTSRLDTINKLPPALLRRAFNGES